MEIQSGRVISKYNEAIHTLYHGWYYTAPLFAAYIVGLYFINNGTSNWEMNAIMEAVLKGLMWIGIRGHQLILIFIIMVISGMTLVVNFERTRYMIVAPNGVYFLRMFSMALFLSFILNSIAHLFVTGNIYLPFSHGIDQLPSIHHFLLKFTTAAGAGFLEELLCRAIILGSLIRVAEYAHLDKVGKIIAILIAALFFSWLHYVHGYGFNGDMFDAQTFVYRAILGIAYGFLYTECGFASAAWTHTLTTLWVSAHVI